MEVARSNDAGETRSGQHGPTLPHNSYVYKYHHSAFSLDKRVSLVLTHELQASKLQGLGFQKLTRVKGRTRTTPSFSIFNFFFFQFALR